MPKILKATNSSVTSKDFLSQLTPAQRAELERNLGEVKKEAPATYTARRDTYTPTLKNGKKGKPIEVLVIVNSKFAWKPASFGIAKLRGILACLDQVKAFVAEQDSAEGDDNE